MNKILILGFGEWNGVWTNPQWMAHELSKLKYDVYYVNPPPYKKIKFSQILILLKRILLRIFRKPSNTFATDSRVKVISMYGIPFFRKLNDKLNSNIFRFILKLNGISIRDNLNCIICQPLWLIYCEKYFKNRFFLITDDYDKIGNKDKTLINFESLLNINNEKIVVTSKFLTNKFKNSVLCTNCIPSQLVSNNSFTKTKKTICFVGTLTDLKIDLNLLINLIDKNPDWTFNFVGEIKSQLIKSFFKKNEQKKIKLYGQLDYFKAYKIIEKSELALMPFKINDYTNSMYSMKFWEYTSAKCYILSTRLKMFENMKPYSHLKIIDNSFLNLDSIMNSFQSKENSWERIQIDLNLQTYNERINKLKKIKYL